MDASQAHDASDKTPPTVALSASPRTVTSAGNISLVAAATGTSAIAKVVIFVDATSLATLATAPYAAMAAVSAADNGTHTFFARATDAAGNVGTSPPVTVMVNISGPPPPAIPNFVGAGPATRVSGATSLVLATPSPIQANDFLIALVDAEEGSGPLTLPTPAGWTLLPGLPIHNLGTAYSPYVIPPGENHGTWIFRKFASASEPATAAFDFAAAATARGGIVAYRGVDLSTPIHDESGQGYYGTGDTNGFGSGSTSLTSARQVNLIASALTASATYTVVQASTSIVERLNTGVQPNGLNLIVHDSPVSFGYFSGPSIANKQSPSGSSDAFLFSATTLVLKPL